MLIHNTWYVFGALTLIFHHVKAQFPPNGDINVFNKMKTAKVLEKATIIREAKLEENLVKRAVHFMKAAEKKAEIDEFVSRGSKIFPGGGDTIPGNENVGEQIIDPRTPTGFGDPFFRQINVEQKIELDAVMTKQEMKEVRALNDDGTLRTSFSLGWTTVAARGVLRPSLDIRRPEFLSLLWVSPNRIIRRQCSSCEGKFKDIFYKRKTEEGLDKKLILMMMGGEDRYGFHESDCGDYDNCDIKNRCNVDFSLYSRYDDAVNDRNPWPHCNTVGYGSGSDMESSSVKIGFPGFSSPDLEVEYDEAQYNEGGAAQQDYAFYVEESNWIPIVGGGLLDIGGQKAGMDYENFIITKEAESLLYASQHMIIRRVCPSCDGIYKDLYYKRISYPSRKLDLWDTLLRDFKGKKGNRYGRDYKIYSTYDDAVTDKNEWEVCERSQVQIGFPGLCHPHIDDDVSIYEEQWVRTREDDITTNDVGSQRDFVFYIEAEDAQMDIGQWMTEDDEMKAFLHSDADLLANETITCDNAAFSHDEEIPGNFIGTLKPYKLLGRDDDYSGWYDLQGCGICSDWCGWFSSDDYFDGGINPYYQSWTETNDLFACITGDSTLPNFYMSGADSTLVEAPFAPIEISQKVNPLVSYVKFFPTHAQKCSQRHDDSPSPPNHKYLGCYKDTSNRALPVSIGSASIENCHTACRERGYHYFGRQDGTHCFCGGTSSEDFSYKKYGESAPISTVSSSGILTNVANIEIDRNGWESCYSSKGKNVEVKYFAQGLNSIPSAGLDATYTPYKTAKMNSINIPFTLGEFASSGRTDWVAASFTSWLQFPVSGTYQLCTTSDDGSMLKVDGVYFVDNNGSHGTRQICSSAYYEANIIKSIVAEYFDAGGGSTMIVSWELPGTSTVVPIPASAYVKAPLSEMPSLCQGESIMFGCRKKGASKWKVVGYGSKDKAFTPTSGENQATIDDTIQWYYDDERSIGFAPEGSSIQLSTSDINQLDDPYRLSWNLDNTDNDWRCGDEIWIENEYERAIWSKDGGGKIDQESFVANTCGDCSLDNTIGAWVNCVFQILYEPEESSETCKDVDMSYSGIFPESSTPYKFQSPPVRDPYAGYYDIQRCGKCNDFCSWVGPVGDGSRVNPEYKAYTDTDYFACKLASEGPDAPLTEKGYFDSSFRYQKCAGEGLETPAYKKEKFIGCFHDKVDDRALPEAVGTGSPAFTLHECATSCRMKRSHYFGRQDNGECWCGGIYEDDLSYAKHGEIDISSSEYCGECNGYEIGANKNCVFQILDMFDPEVERKKHECSHISFVDVRRYCYVACRDQDENFKNLLACKTNKVKGLMYLNQEIAAWMDSPKCGRKPCKKKRHPLGRDVERSAGTF